MKSGFLSNLRKQGYQVKIRHMRNFWNNAASSAENALLQMTRGEFVHKCQGLNLKDYILGKGGRTEVTAIAPTGEAFQGTAICHPSDNYHRIVGIETALKNAFEQKKYKIEVADALSTFQVVVLV